jgi:hypothetical protein
MQVTVDVPLTLEETNQLAGILKTTAQNLEATFIPYCAAAVEEQVRMILGQKVFTRGSDVREYRLLLLIQHAFDGRIPDEQTVSDLFQTTVTQSRSLIRSVMSKFQYDLSGAIEETLRYYVSSAVRDELGPDFCIVLNSESIVEAINRRLAAIDGALPQLAKKRGTVANYTIRPSSLNRLCQALGIPSPVENV